MRTAIGSGQRGQSLVQYLVVAVFACLVLTLGHPSPLDMFMDAVKQFYANFTFAISLP